MLCAGADGHAADAAGLRGRTQDDRRRAAASTAASRDRFAGARRARGC